MAQREGKGNNPHRLAIEGEMTIYRASELKDILLQPLAKHREVEVDLSGVSEMDSAGLQLMVMAKRESLARQCALRFTAHSPAVLAVLDLCDLASLFGDPVVLPSHAAP